MKHFLSVLFCLIAAVLMDAASAKTDEVETFTLETRQGKKYEQAQILGFEADGIRLMHAHLHINGASLMLHDEFPEYVSPEEADVAGGSGLTLHLHVNDADRWLDRAVAAGATATMPIEDMFWGDRYGQVKDPFGYRWSIAHSLNKDA